MALARYLVYLGGGLRGLQFLAIWAGGNDDRADLWTNGIWKDWRWNSREIICLGQNEQERKSD